MWVTGVMVEVTGVIVRVTSVIVGVSCNCLGGLTGVIVEGHVSWWRDRCHGGDDRYRMTAITVGLHGCKKCLNRVAGVIVGFIGITVWVTYATVCYSYICKLS